MRTSTSAWCMCLLLAGQSARAEEDANVVRAHFTTNASASDVQARACAFTAFQVEGQSRAWLVTVGDHRCSSAPPDADSVPLHVVINEVEGRRDVTLEASSDDISDETLRRAVTSAGITLRDGPPQVTFAPPVQQNRSTAAPDTKAPSRGKNTAVVAVAATAGGIAVAATVAIVVIVVVVVSGFIALFAAIGKALH